MRVPVALCGVLLCACALPLVSAQDAVKADSKHYSVVSENDQVRILKVHYGPHEKSVMHSHPASVAVFLTDSTALFTLPRRQDTNHEREGRRGDEQSSRHSLAGEYRRQAHGTDSG